MFEIQSPAMIKDLTKDFTVADAAKSFVADVAVKSHHMYNMLLVSCLT